MTVPLQNPFKRSILSKNRTLLLKMSQARMQFGNHSVALFSDNREVLSPLQQFWGQFFAPESVPSADIEIHVSLEPGGFSGHSEFRQFNNGNLFVMSAATKAVTISFAARPWQAYIQIFREHPVSEIYHILVEPTLVLILKRLGWFYGHCSCVEFAGRGILLPGSSGSGKTTTATQLLLHGANHLCDDRLLLSHGPDGRVQAHRVERRPHLSLCLDTPRLFPEAAGVGDSPEYRKGQRTKRYLDVAQHYPDQVKGECFIDAVIFPRVAAAEDTRLVALDPAEVILRWMRQEPIEYHTLLADRLADAAQFGLFSHLATSMACYELVLGRRMETLPDLLLTQLAVKAAPPSGSVCPNGAAAFG